MSHDQAIMCDAWHLTRLRRYFSDAMPPRLNYHERFGQLVRGIAAQDSGELSVNGVDCGRQNAEINDARPLAPHKD